MESNRHKKTLILGLQLVIVAMGLLRFAGDTFRIKKLDQIGFASGFSPLPLVFSDREGIEDFAHIMKINYVTVSGIHKSVDFDQKFYSSIPGALSMVGTYAVAIAYSPRFPEMLWKPALVYGFCNHGTLARTMNENELIKSVEIRITHLEKNYLTWGQKLECAI
ncbi:MAG: hypothetical protein H7177_06140 [Rhizobacter sp.]|nr:hypothetical protein [Bacteriovorax sp.]